jgi:hypothetical protein
VKPSEPPKASPDTFSKGGTRGHYEYWPHAAIHHGDSLQILPTIPSNSADSIVSDLPAGIGFMGKHWDRDRGGRDQWILWMQSIAVEAFRVAKPGAHALLWALPRTAHWTMTAFENAGWEIRDVVHHLFGTGFPKSVDVSKAIDKKAGAEREVIGESANSRDRAGDAISWDQGKPFLITAPATAEAKQWEGYGTGLKPAVEHWILLKKPFIGTIAANVLIHGTGAINIAACRVAANGEPTGASGGWGFTSTKGWNANNIRARRKFEMKTNQGRWPANLVLSPDERVMAGFPDTKGCSSLSTAMPEGRVFGGRRSQGAIYDDAGSAARYFNQFDDDEAIYIYAHKANKADRNGSRHPTVKSQKLMEWLVRLITPPGGTVLEPFAGSGSTGLAACTQGFSCILIEQELEYIEDCRKRLALWL